jgi:hypothetical protein
MAIRDPIIKNITDFTSSNVEEIKKKIDNGEIESIEKLYELIDPNAINKDNKNKVIKELESLNLKKIKKENDNEVAKVVTYFLPDECKIKDPEVKNIEVDGDEKLNELIELINTKFNIINKIL